MCRGWRTLSYKPHSTSQVLSYIIKQNLFSPTFTVLRYFKSSKSHLSLKAILIATHYKIHIKKQIKYYQSTMAQNIHYHTKRKEWGQSKEIPDWNPAEHMLNSVTLSLTSKSLDGSILPTLLNVLPGIPQLWHLQHPWVYNSIQALLTQLHIIDSQDCLEGTPLPTMLNMAAFLNWGGRSHTHFTPLSFMS